MLQLNSNYDLLQKNYLFSEIASRVQKFSKKKTNPPIIKLGIGDVTLPLVPPVVSALHEAIDEMAQSDSFKGYGPEQGYLFLREAICQHDFQNRSLDISPDDIFVSDGAKCDTGNIQELFGPDCIVSLSDPVYPVYLDSQIMAGRSGHLNENGHYSRIVYLPLTEENNFIPLPPNVSVDLIYLCSPNNPTGAVCTYDNLRQWVQYAHKHQSIILFDSAYEAFIQDTTIPRSIYEIEGAKEVAIEFRSFSKTAGFTGLRCAYTVVPKELKIRTPQGNLSLNQMWQRRQSTKFNGVSYVIQKGALATYSDEGRHCIQENICYYRENISLIYQALRSLGLKVFGGEHSPYVWFKVPSPFSSWEFFDKLLESVSIVGTPGVGFGKFGEGYFRLTGFGEREQTVEAVSRLQKLSL